MENIGYAFLNKCIIAPRKMRFVADSIRGKDVVYALAVLDCEQKKCAVYFKKLLLSAVANYKKKCEENKTTASDKSQLVISTLTVDGDGMLKRLLPAPQGRGYRKRRRSSSVRIVVSQLEKKITTFNKVAKKNAPKKVIHKEDKNVKL